LATIGSGLAVRVVELDRLEENILDLDGYQRALVIFKFAGAVVGQVWLPVIAGRIDILQIREKIPAVTWQAWQRLMLVSKDPGGPLPSATVVVCTRDRTAELGACIPGLSRLATQGYQVIVVDNCPSDGSTAKLVSDYPELLYILEPRPGLDVARNRGLQAAVGEVVAFIDDDARPDEGWLAALLRNFDDPMVAVVTGITLPIELDTAAQQWFEQSNGFGRGFERRVFEATMMSILGTGRVGAGVNMAVRRSALAEIGMFDEALDGGTPTLSGGDQEFFYRTLAHGYRIVYDPAALVWHSHRREWSELRRTIYGYGVGLYAWWTRALLVEGELTVLFWGPRWFWQHHVRNLAQSLLRRPGCAPRDLAWAEFRGALAGPASYWRSRRRLRQLQRAAAGTPAQALTFTKEASAPDSSPQILTTYPPAAGKPQGVEME
jgi:glycosyltransferase involved in cell wall biosynthesis